jgi:hypothetical protein
MLYGFVRPLSCEGLRKVRVGNPTGDGGYVMADDFGAVSGALSLGIGDDISWDLSIAARGIPVFQFDHTVEPPESGKGNPLLHFNKVGIGAVDSDAGPMRTISRILSEEMAGCRGDLILKMDIDGAEWDVLAAMPDDVLARFRQICIEVHNPLGRPSDGAARMRNLRIFERLATSFAPVHLHANNAGPVRTFLGSAVPKLLEITYLRRDGRTFAPSQEAFPGPLDVPNVRNVPEIPLDGFLKN